MPDRRVTLDDIAARCSLHRSTVQAALADRRDIAATTKERVRRIADELGYRPDPLLSALAAYRTRSTNSKYKANLAWLWMSEPGPLGSKRERPFNQFPAAQEAADRLGYGLEMIDAGSTDKAQQATSRMMYHRGVLGVICDCWPLLPSDIAIEWKSFARVIIHRTSTPEVPSAVREDYFDAMTQIVCRLALKGYKRPAWFSPYYPDDSPALYELEAAFYFGRRHFKLDDNIPVLACAPPMNDRIRNMDEQALVDWLREWNPDCLICHHPVFGDLLREVLPHAGLAAFSEPGRHQENLSGVVRPYEQIAALAVDQLHNQVLRDARSQHLPSIEVTVAYNWNEGQTLPDISKQQKVVK